MTRMIKIKNKIVAQEVVKSDEPVFDVMNENIARPEVLQGKTYKVKIPTEEHSLYVTINDILLNGGTTYESKHPFEIFINSKNNTHRQWVDTLTRVISAVFRKGGDINFLVEELKAITDPQGGGWHKGRYVKSVVSEIGYVLEEHLLNGGVEVESPTPIAVNTNEIPGAKFCPKCQEKAVISKDNCDTCLSCGDSKCG